MADLNLIQGEARALKQRGITLETASLFGYHIGKYKGKPCHIANYYTPSGELCAQHLRLEGKEFVWLGDAKKAALFGQHLWRDGGRKVIVTEGEIDCMSISQLQGNKWPVVSLTSGAASGEKNFRLCLEFLERFEEVVLAFDMDEPGQEAAKKCAMVLTPGKAKIARLPMKDANECLLNGKTKELLDALWGAKTYRPEGILSGADLWERIKTRPIEGKPIPYPILNEKIQGIRPRELILFTAGSGIGKSTIVNEIAYHLRMTHGLPLGVIALEESVERNAQRYMGIYLNKPIYQPQAFDTVPEETLEEAFKATVKTDWHILNHHGSSDIDTLLGKIRYLIVGCQCQVLVLDHISIVVSGLSEGEESERKTIDRLMTALRSIIQETGCTVLAVVHLKRPDKGKSYNEGRAVSLTDLRGSGSLEQISDIVIALERDQQGEHPNQADIRILKNRPVGITGPAGHVWYNPETGRLLDYTPEDDGAAGYGFPCCEPDGGHDAPF